MTKARTLADNFAADINGITAGTGITGGGTSGTVTITNDMATAINAKGDLVVGTGADAYARLAVASTAGYLLSVDSAEATGLKWAAPAGGGKVLQVIQGSNSSSFSTSSTSFVDITGLSASITPSDSAHKVLIMYFINGATRLGDDDNGIIFDIVRGSSTTVTGELRDVGYTGNSIGTIGSTLGGCFLDSPSTTSSTTYKARIRCNNAGLTAYAQVNNVTSTIILLEIDN